jgi:hypothetical protein
VPKFKYKISFEKKKMTIQLLAGINPTNVVSNVSFLTPSPAYTEHGKLLILPTFCIFALTFVWRADRQGPLLHFAVIVNFITTRISIFKVLFSRVLPLKMRKNNLKKKVFI